jgi:hypothetical protein
MKCAGKFLFTTIWGVLSLIFLCLPFGSSSQTVVQLGTSLEQSEAPFEVSPVSHDRYVLNEPVGIDVTSIAMVTGGFGEYAFVWIENDSTLSNESSVTIVPQENSTYSLLISDELNCSALVPIYTDGTQDILQDTNSTLISLYPTYVEHAVTVEIPDFITGAQVVFTDGGGRVVKDVMISTTTVVPVELPSGFYLVSVMWDNYCVNKQIVVK